MFASPTPILTQLHLAYSSATWAGSAVSRKQKSVSKGMGGPSLKGGVVPLSSGTKRRIKFTENDCYCYLEPFSGFLKKFLIGV